MNEIEETWLAFREAVIQHCPARHTSSRQEQVVMDTGRALAVAAIVPCLRSHVSSRLDEQACAQCKAVAEMQRRIEELQ